VLEFVRVQVAVRVCSRALPHVCTSGYAYKSGPPAREMYSEAEVASTYRRTTSFPSSRRRTARYFLSAFLRYLVPRSPSTSFSPSLLSLSSFLVDPFVSCLSFSLSCTRMFVCVKMSPTNERERERTWGLSERFGERAIQRIALGERWKVSNIYARGRVLFYDVVDVTERDYVVVTKSKDPFSQ